MAKCNQLTSLPFKGLNRDGIVDGDNLTITTVITHYFTQYRSFGSVKFTESRPILFAIKMQPMFVYSSLQYVFYGDDAHCLCGSWAPC